MKQNWTIREVKDQLPNIKVKMRDGSITDAHVGSRKRKFARVWLPNGGYFQAAWQAIVNCLNGNGPLTV